MITTDQILSKIQKTHTQMENEMLRRQIDYDIIAGLAMTPQITVACFSTATMYDIKLKSSGGERASFTILLKNIDMVDEVISAHLREPASVAIAGITLVLGYDPLTFLRFVMPFILSDIPDVDTYDWGENIRITASGPVESRLFAHISALAHRPGMMLEFVKLLPYDEATLRYVRSVIPTPDKFSDDFSKLYPAYHWMCNYMARDTTHDASVFGMYSSAVTDYHHYRPDLQAACAMVICDTWNIGTRTNSEMLETYRVLNCIVLSVGLHSSSWFDGCESIAEMASLSVAVAQGKQSSVRAVGAMLAQMLGSDPAVTEYASVAFADHPDLAPLVDRIGKFKLLFGSK